MITDDQIIALACATIRGAEHRIPDDIVASVSRRELLKFAKEVIDAATVGLRAELLALQSADKLLAECVIEREQLRQALQTARIALVNHNEHHEALFNNARARFELHQCRLRGWTLERIVREIDAEGDYSHPALQGDWYVWCAALMLEP